MGGAGATITIDDARLRGALANLAAFGSERSAAAFDEIGEAMVSSTHRRMNAEIGPDGVAWKKSQRALKVGGKTLQDTRRMFLSMVHNVLSAAQGAAGVEWGTNVVYASVHQLGKTIVKYAQSRPIYRQVKDGAIQPGFVKRKKSNFESWHEQPEHSITIPARPFIGFSGEDAQEVTEILGRHLRAAALGLPPGAAA